MTKRRKNSKEWEYLCKPLYEIYIKQRRECNTQVQVQPFAHAKYDPKVPEWTSTQTPLTLEAQHLVWLQLNNPLCVDQPGGWSTLFFFFLLSSGVVSHRLSWTMKLQDFTEGKKSDFKGWGLAKICAECGTATHTRRTFVVLYLPHHGVDEGNADSLYLFLDDYGLHLRILQMCVKNSPNALVSKEKKGFHCLK